MITVLGESSSREELEQKFVAQHCPVATSWPISRAGRTTTWVHPSGAAKIVVEIVAWEYIAPGDAAGHFADALTWDEKILRLRDGAWTPATVRLTSAKPTKKPKLV